MAAKLDSPKVTVVIPWGKATGNITRCITSSLEQTLSSVEVLVIANGAVSSATIAAVRKDADFSAVAFYHLVGCNNANVARNFGAAIGHGEWVAFLDSDDWWDPPHLHESIAELEKEGADLIYSGMRLHYATGAPKNLVASDYRDHAGIENYLLEYLPAQTSSYVARRSSVLSQPWNCSLNRHQDYEFLSRMSTIYKVTHKEAITVNVDWSEPTRHRHYGDCMHVLQLFKDKTKPHLYYRHQWNLTRMAVRAFDFGALKYSIAAVVAAFYLISDKIKKVAKPGTKS